MSWLALLLIGMGVSDLVFSVRRISVVPEAIGAAAVIGFGLVAGLTSTRDVVALLVIAAAVVLWSQTLTRGFAQDREWLPLSVWASAVSAAVLLSPWAGVAGGPLQDWLALTSFAPVSGLAADRVLLLVGALLLQLSTGNVLVRLVFAATGTLNPAKVERSNVGTPLLKGGRLLGPLERLFIVGLGLAGQFTAAGIVIAAKGLLRFPELQSRRDQERIHQLTEYFLVGSFVSWLIALSTLGVLAS